MNITDEMVERAAEATAHEYMQTTPYYIAWSRLDDRGKRHYRKIARAALEAALGGVKPLSDPLNEIRNMCESDEMFHRILVLVAEALTSDAAVDAHWDATDGYITRIPSGDAPAYRREKARRGIAAALRAAGVTKGRET